MKIPFVTFRPMERELDAELRAAFTRVFENSWYIDGAEDKAFEDSKESILKSVTLSYRYMRQFVI